ncbi:amino acid adenylation domain-containing protein [Vibrio coralliilyticus]|uniref:non-ribosomal peptide synthetase n=1 Tax=Vibrio coralliilyticus TaxID=190893 RepID=UPI0039175A69
MKNNNPVFETISMQSSISPEAIAVIYKDKSLTYSELELQSNQLASYLVNQYPDGDKGKVAVYLEPSLMLPVVILGVMKAGFSYVPLSSFQPTKRIQQILDDSGAFLIITDELLSKKPSMAECDTEKLNVAALDLAGTLHCQSLPKVSHSDLAYTLYTSGSTGVPKGVEVEHGSMAYYLDWFNHDLWPETQATLPLTSSLSFAAAVTQLFAPLLRGDTLHILPEGTLNNPQRLFDWYQNRTNTAIYCVPTIWNELLNYRCSFDSALSLPETVFLSGEPIGEDIKQRTFDSIENVRLFNLYGPTETVANCAFTELEPDQPVTIGKALAGSELFLLDEKGALVTDGSVGEICICGPGVARGYSHRPELSAERFFSHRGHSAHRTGDLGQFNANGDLVCLGRKDRQVKIHGVRVELGEIEANLRQHGEVADAAVKMVNGGLVAYLLTDKKPSAWDLRVFLSERCPSAMMPAQFVYLESFPKLPNGKLDSARLPEPAPVRPELNYDCNVPANDLERDLVDIWQEVLGFSGLGVDDDFFDLGGNSLQAMRARTLIRRRLYSEIDFKLFFSNATPRKLAAVVPYYLADDLDDATSTPNEKNQEAQFEPLTSQQAYFLTLEQTSANPKAYQPAFCIYLEGKASSESVEWCLNRVLASNPILTTQFDLDNFTAKEGGYGAGKVEIPHRKVEHVSGKLSEMPHCDLLDMADMPDIDIDREPPIRLALLSKNDDEHVIVVRVHHAVFDHDSIGIFFEQFVQAYRAYMAGDYGFAQHHQHHLSLKQHRGAMVDEESQMQFWLSALNRYLTKGADSSLYPKADYPSPQGYAVELSQPFSQAIKDFAHAHNTTAYVVLLMLFNLVLNHETRYHNITIGLPVSNRALCQNDGQLGCFVNMVTYHEQVDQVDSVVSLIEASSKAIYSLIENQSVSYLELADEMRSKGWLEKLRFPVTFNYLSAMPEVTEVQGCRMKVQHIAEQSARCDLTLTVDDGEQLTLNFDYESTAFTKQQITLLAEQYLALISDTLSL